MNPCDSREAELSAILDNGADHAQIMESMDHLSKCSNCRQFWFSARAMNLRMAPLREGSLPKPLSDALWQQISTQSGLSTPSVKWWRKPMTLGPLLVGAILLLAFAFFTNRQASDHLNSDLTEFELSSEQRPMTDRHFLEILKRILESEPKYQQKMFLIMKDLYATYPELEIETEYRSGEPESLRPIDFEEGAGESEPSRPSAI